MAYAVSPKILVPTMGDHPCGWLPE